MRTRVPQMTLAGDEAKHPRLYSGQKNAPTMQIGSINLLAKQ